MADKLQNTSDWPPCPKCGKDYWELPDCPVTFKVNWGPASEIAAWAERCAMNLQNAAAPGGAHPCECMAFARDLRERIDSALERARQVGAQEALAMGPPSMTPARQFSGADDRITFWCAVILLTFGGVFLYGWLR